MCFSFPCGAFSWYNTPKTHRNERNGIRMKDHAALARENFHRGYNCAQSVACAFSAELGMEESQVARLVCSFGGGMGRLREVCGAVSGALFVLGALRGYGDPAATDEKAAHYARVQEFARRFRAEHETIICRELLSGVPLQNGNAPVPEARTDAYYRVRPCARFVETAARIAEAMLSE